MSRTLAIGLWTAAAALTFSACEAPTAVEAPAAPTAAVADAVRQAWDGARLNVRESADLMPEADYDFAPVDGVRGFGAILAHIAGANYVFCSAARGEPAPYAEDAFEASATTKDAILDESRAYCDEAYAAATDASLADPVALPFGGGDGPRAGALLGNVAHLDEHYGNLVTYFRLKGIVPPSSRR
jgi:hypothetical protein